ncbi:MAG: hypothetical protein B6243_06570 [Anaerolineaceae bacterium 4572_5.2]|nr:MAG: hypothetical protein B6243_06570 [Anaerolineaceae bacterium 4572_5.2]
MHKTPIGPTGAAMAKPIIIPCKIIASDIVLNPLYAHCHWSVSVIQFKDFMDALNFTSRVGHLAETESHHPAQGCSVLRQCHCEAYFAE